MRRPPFWLISTVLTFWAATAVAEYGGLGLPALYDVTGVAQDDTLNIRRDPDSHSEILGTFNPDQDGIEIIALSDDDKWGRIIWDGGNGWVSMRFLIVQPNSLAAFPESLSCLGTEPFWNIDIEDPVAVYNDISGAQRIYDMAWWFGSRNNAYQTFAIGLEDPAGKVTGVLSRQICSDGASDIDYGWGLNLISEPGSEPGLLSGCCSAGYAPTY